MKRAKITYHGLDAELREDFRPAGDTPQERVNNAARWILEWNSVPEGVALLTRLRILKQAMFELDRE